MTIRRRQQPRSNMTLRDDLKEISGVGDKTADKVLEAVAAHNDADETDAMQRALLFLNRGKPHIAQDVLQSALDG